MTQIPESLKALSTPLDDLVLDPENARLHSKRNIDAVAKSLQKYGWRQVVVARHDSKVVLSGNARVIAARQIGMTHAPVLFVSDSDRSGKAYAIADNRTAELAEWDLRQLGSQLDELLGDEETGIDAIIGFSEDEIANLTAAQWGDGDSSPEDFSRGAEKGTTKEETLTIVLTKSEMEAVMAKRAPAFAKSGRKRSTGSGSRSRVRLWRSPGIASTPPFGR